MDAVQSVLTALASRQDVSDVIAQSRELARQLDGASRQDLVKICAELEEVSNSLAQLIKAAKVRSPTRVSRSHCKS